MSISLLSTMSLEIVPATLVPNTNAATKLKMAAQSTACVGESTRVATMVAIDFAAEEVGHGGVVVVVADAFLVVNFDQLVGEIGKLARFAETGDGFVHRAS